MTCTLLRDTLTKEFVDNGAINVSTNRIVDKPTFNQLNKSYSKHIQEKFNLDTLEMVFNVEGDKALPNAEFLSRVDRMVHPELDHEERFLSDLQNGPGVRYNFKAMEILTSEKAKDVFEKGAKNNWDIAKILTELQVPKEQKAILLDLKTSNLDELIMGLAALSYGVEINTATEDVSQYGVDTDPGYAFDPMNFEIDGSEYHMQLDEESFTTTYSKDSHEITERKFWVARDEAEKAYKKGKSTVKNTQRFKNMTVPGGVNYTENAVQTPDIINVSELHTTDFSRGIANMLGWFRSDEKINEEGSDGETRRILEVQSDLFQKNRNKKKLVASKNETLAERMNLDFGEMDLKTGLYKDEEARRYHTNIQFLMIKGRDAELAELIASIPDRYKKDKNGNKFLQLLNQKGNWVNFFLQSIVQDSIKKGYARVRFPSGETAARVEGHSLIAERIEAIEKQVVTAREFAKRASELPALEKKKADFKANAKQPDREVLVHQEPHLDEEQKKEHGVEAYQFVRVQHSRAKYRVGEHRSELGGGYNGYYIFAYNTDTRQGQPSETVLKITPAQAQEIWDGKEMPAMSDQDHQTLFNMDQEIRHIKDSGKQLERLELSKKEMKEQGIEQLAPIEAFYTNRVANILNKRYDTSKVTDEHGNTWVEIDLTTDIAKNAKVQLSKAELLKKIAGSRRIEQNKKDFYSRLDGFEQTPPSDDSESMSTAEEKIKRMKQVFNVEVIEDTEMDASGALLGANHPLSIKSGGPVIVINPNKLFSDTVFHEFGHLYIDLLGGLNDPEVAVAVKQLRGSQLWADVAEAYPELSEDDLAKEVLATALGREGNNIYNGDVVEESIWQQMKKALLIALNKIFNTRFSYNALENIASQMLSGNTRLSAGASFNSIIDQYSRLKIDGEPNQEKIDKLFNYLSEKYELDELTHEYRDLEEDKLFKNSVTSFAKQLTLGNHNFNIKGDYYMELSGAYELSKLNYQVLFDESRIPWSLDQALTDFFNGDIDGAGLLVNNNDENMSWSTYYNTELLGSALMSNDDIHQGMVDNLDMINEHAKMIEKNKNTPMMMGNVVHKALEEYVEDGTEFPGTLIDTKSNQLINEIKHIVDTGKANGSKFYTEQMLFSEAAQKPGTADLIEITKEGKFKIYDFKTTKSFTNSMGQPKSDYQMYIRPGYLNQLIIYSTILEEYGLKPADNHLNIVSIQVDGARFDPDNPDESVVVIKNVINKNLDPSDKNFTSNFQDARRKIVASFRNPIKLKDFNLKTKEEKVDLLVQKIQRGIIDYKAFTNSRSGKFTADSLNTSNRGLHQLEEEFEKLAGDNNGLVLYRFVENMREALHNVYLESTHPSAMLSSNYLKNVDYLLQAATFIPEIKRFIQESSADYAIDGVEKQELMELMTEAGNAANQVKDMHVEKTRELAVNTLASNSNFMAGLFAEKFEVEARKKNLKTKEEISDYVFEQMNLQANKDIIAQKEYEYWKGLLENGYTDIRYFEYLLADPGMNKSQFVQVVKNVLDKVDNDVRIDLDKSIPGIVKWFSDLKMDTKGDPAKVWKRFLNKASFKDINGKQVEYTHGSVVPEFTSEYREIFVDYQYRLDDLNRNINTAFENQNTELVESLKEKRDNLKIERTEALKGADKESTMHPEFAKLSKDEKEALRFIHDKLDTADDRLHTAKTKMLVRVTRDGNKIYNLPRMRKSNIEAAYDAKGMLNTFSSKIEDFMRPPADEDELNMSGEERREFENYKTKNTDIIGEPSYDIPVFYRNQLDDPTLQSFDIPTLLAMNEETTIAYKEHKMVEADLFMITNSLKNAKSLKTDAIVSNNVVDKLNGRLPKSLQSTDKLTLKAVEASINNRFYKRSYQGSYSKWHYRGIKAAEALGKGTSMLLLAGNFRSASMTGLQGTIYRFIEGVAGENFSLADAKTGSMKAYSDIQGVIADTQKQFPTSKTNLLLRRFGLETQYEALVNKFVQDNFVTKNLDEGAMYAITTIAETIVTANLMYTLMNNIKVMNDNGDFINKEGKAVPKKKAMSLDEAYDVVDGVLTLNKHVVYTEMNPSDKFNDVHVGEHTGASTEISRYIRSIYADLYGQYNQDMKSVAEMHVVGKLAFSMRKWIPRGYHRRWRGITSVGGYSFEELRKEENAYKRFYSQDQKKFQEGYYTTGFRFAATMLKEAKQHNISFMAAATKVNNTLTTHEHANLKRLAYEFLVIGVSFFSALALRGIAKAMGDDDDRSQDKMYYLLYLLERIKMESATFVNPIELINNLKNPAAAVNTIDRLYNVFEQIVGFSFDDDGAIDFSINDEFDRGLREGDLKIGKHLQNLVPWVKNAGQIKGVFGFDSKETVKDSWEFLIRS